MNVLNGDSLLFIRFVPVSSSAISTVFCINKVQTLFHIWLWYVFFVITILPFLTYFTGGPLVNITIWIFLRIHFYKPNNANDIIKDCPFFEVTQVDFFACEIPIFFILIINTFFLIWIMVVSFSKLLILYAKKLFFRLLFQS